MTFSCLTILGILGAGELAQGLLCLLAGLTRTPRDHVLSGLSLLVFAVGMSGLCGYLGGRSHG
jgi:hypothetical protein